MKVVIDIPEEEYERCKKQWDIECLDTLMIAVKYGTPLPKMRGRLIDAEGLKAKVYRACMDNHFMPARLMTCDDITDIIDGFETTIEIDVMGYKDGVV